MTSQYKLVVSIFFVSLFTLFLKYAVDTCLPDRGSTIFSSSFVCLPPAASFIGADSRVVGVEERQKFLRKPDFTAVFTEPTLFLRYVPKDFIFNLVLVAAIGVVSTVIAWLWSRVG